jgi:hypothetical protein
MRRVLIVVLACAVVLVGGWAVLRRQVQPSPTANATASAKTLSPPVARSEAAAPASGYESIAENVDVAAGAKDRRHRGGA